MPRASPKVSTTPPAQSSRDQASRIPAEAIENHATATRAPITLGDKTLQSTSISALQPPHFRAPPSTAPLAAFSKPSRASSSTAASSNRDSRRSLAQSLARQRDTIIGEHIYKARYQSPGVLVDETKSTNSSPVLATSNPFGPRRPSTASTSSTILPSISETSNTYVTDLGAAARNQYGGLKLDIPPSQPAWRPNVSPFDSESPGSTATSQARPRITPAKGTGPALPAFLQGAQSSSSNTPPSSTTSRAPPRRVTPLTGSGPSLPAFLQGASASADIGEAVRRQYGPQGGRKKADDPMEIARKRGF